MIKQYTNELTPEMLACMDQSPFTPEQLAEINDEARGLIGEQEAFFRQHPVVAIYRIAVDGAQTQRGGVVRPSWNGGEVLLEDGRKVNVALEGDAVVYPDGSTARIVTGSGRIYRKGVLGIALVGSRLSNGDVIVSTPQSRVILVEREGLPMDPDFLPEEG